MDAAPSLSIAESDADKPGPSLALFEVALLWTCSGRKRERYWMWTRMPREGLLEIRDRDCHCGIAALCGLISCSPLRKGIYLRDGVDEMAPGKVGTVAPKDSAKRGGERWNARKNADKGRGGCVSRKILHALVAELMGLLLMIQMIPLIQMIHLRPLIRPSVHPIPPLDKEDP